MTIFFTVTLAISIAGLVSLLGFRRWEISTGRVLGGSVRPVATTRLGQGLAWLEYQGPALLRTWARSGVAYVEALLHRFVALIILLVERGLERVLHSVRRTTAIKPSNTEASAFLREVSAHKKQLVKATRKERSVYEE